MSTIENTVKTTDSTVRQLPTDPWHPVDVPVTLTDDGMPTVGDRSENPVADLPDMTFERVGGRFVPLPPRRGRKPDGRRYFTVDQVAAETGKSPDHHRADWRAWYGDQEPDRYFKLVGDQPVPCESYAPDALDLRATLERLGTANWTEAKLVAIHEAKTPEQPATVEQPPPSAPFVGNGTVAPTTARLEAAGYSPDLARAVSALMAIRDAGELLDEVVAGDGPISLAIDDARTRAVRRLGRLDRDLLWVVGELVARDAGAALAAEKKGARP